MPSYARAQARVMCACARESVREYVRGCACERSRVRGVDGGGSGGGGGWECDYPMTPMNMAMSVAPENVTTIANTFGETCGTALQALRCVAT